MGRSAASEAREKIRARSTRKLVGRRSAAGDGSDGGEGGQGCLTGHPAFTAVAPAYAFERMPEGGGYPVGLIEFAGEKMGVTHYSRVLHLCSGSVRSALALDWRPPWGRWGCPPEKPFDHEHLYGANCALRQSCGHEPAHGLQPGSSCSVVGDARRLPIGDGLVEWIMVDPPYDEEYAQALWGTGKVYPTPTAVLNECARVLRPGGAVAFLHQVVPLLPKALKREATWGITTGPGYRIRALTIARRTATLFE